MPDLGSNIKCGNSLIGPDFYDNQQLDLLDEEERYRINVFDWEAEFPDIMGPRGGDSGLGDRDSGLGERDSAIPSPKRQTRDPNYGFDAVIGNPPYVRMESFADVKAYLRAKYKAHEERADIYAYFIERALSVANAAGRIGMIVSNKFIRAKYGRPLRQLLHKDASVEALADFAGARVFRGATVRTVVLFLRRKSTKVCVRPWYVPRPSPDELSALESGRLTVTEYASHRSFELDSSAIAPSEWQLVPATTSNILERIRLDRPMLSELIGHTAMFGLKTGLNDAFIVDDERHADLLTDDSNSVAILKPILFGKDIRRYAVRFAGRYVIYPHPDVEIAKFPAVKSHLAQYRPALTKRAGPQEWYELQQPALALLPELTRPRIVYPIIANQCRFALDDAFHFINDKAFLLPTADRRLLAILNSRVANFYFGSVCAALEGTRDRYLEFRAQYVDRFPVPRKVSQRGSWNELDHASTRMLELHKELDAARTPVDKTAIGRQIEATDRQIDQLVYELYGLTDDEIKIVEEATRQ